jgi:tripartite-type tricarboxylate transporter receptor subunit TctC
MSNPTEAVQPMFPIFATALLCVLAGTTMAQAPIPASGYANKAIRIVVTFPPGGSSDTIGRIIGQKLSERLGQPVIIDNRPGGGGSIGVDAVVRAAPDGYTLVLGAAGGLALNTVLYKKLPYDPTKDLALITRLVTSPMIVAINPALARVASVQELVAMIKAKPGPTAFASGGTGTGMHLAGELFKVITASKMFHVPYKGNGPALTDLIGGQVPIAFTDFGSTPPFTKGGRVKVLAIASPTRSRLAPDVPSAPEAGLPRWEALGWLGLAAPAGTPPEIVNRLYAEVTAILRQPDVIEKILATGNEPAPMTPEEFGNYIRSEIARWGKIVAVSGIPLE